MKFLGADILQTIVYFFESIRDILSLEYLLYIFVGLEVLTIIIFIILTYYVYELRLLRTIDKLNEYLYNVQYINESNLIEFNKMMKRVPKTLRYHWQQYMLYREKNPSYYMSIENCIDRPIKASVFASNIKILKSLGIIYAVIAFIFCCGWASGLAVVNSEYIVSITTIPLVVLLLNHILIIALNSKRANNTKNLYQTFHIFNRFIDKAVTTMPDYVDFEVLFTRKEIKRGIPVLNEYIEKRQIQEQEEMRKAKENAITHEMYNFEESGEKGELVLERAMKETEILVSLKNRLDTEIDQIEREIDSLKRSYENTTKDYQKKLQASKENIDRLREQQEATTNRIESNYIRKQQSDEIKKQQQIEKDQDDATLRFNQEISTLETEIKKRKGEIEESRLNVEKAMLSEYKTFSNKIFSEIKEDVNQRFKDERENLINMRESMAKELEVSLSRIEQLEKQNKALVAKSGERESFIRAEIGKENEILKEKINDLKETIEEKDQYISLIIENPNAKMKFKKPKYEEKKDKGKDDKNVIEGEFSFEDSSKKFFSNFDGPVGEFDEKGNYKYSNGSYYDPDGNFHDENGNVFDPQGNLLNQKQAGILETNILKDEVDDIAKTEIKEDTEKTEKSDKEFGDFDVDEENKEKEKSLTSNEILDLWDEENEENAAEVENKDEAGAEEITKNQTDNEESTEVDDNEIKEDQIDKLDEDETGENLGISNKKKRGRPRKEKPDEPTEKRSRGRPKKEKTEEEVGPKRSRGRPKKENVEPPKPKGKRGRPRKESNTNNSENINMDDLKEIESKIKKQNDILKSQQEDLKNTLKKTTKK